MGLSDGMKISESADAKREGKGRRMRLDCMTNMIVIRLMAVCAVAGSRIRRGGDM
jgi:hypothetical protein